MAFSEGLTSCDAESELVAASVLLVVVELVVVDEGASPVAVVVEGRLAPVERERPDLL